MPKFADGRKSQNRKSQEQKDREYQTALEIRLFDAMEGELPADQLEVVVAKTIHAIRIELTKTPEWF
jgi:hypothetical protein